LKSNSRKKAISIFLTLTMIFNTLLQIFSGVVVHAQDFQYSACYPDAASGTVKFIVKYSDGGVNPSDAYVVGDFNNWSFDSKYLLTWQQDPNDGVWKMMGRFSVAPGTHDYKFRLHYGSGSNDPNNDQWIDPNGGNGGNGTFTLQALTEGMKISSSRNQISAGETVSLVSDLYNIDGTIVELTPSYSIDPAISGVSVDNNGTLRVDGTVKDGTSINVKAVTSEGKVAVKTIKVVNSDALAGQKKVQYFRYDANSYEGWNVWAWTGDKASSYCFNESTDFGKLAGIETNTNFKLRKSISGNDWAEQAGDMAVPEATKELYVVENDNKIYTDFRQAVNAAKPKVINAIMDSKNQITAYLTHIPKDGTSFEVYANGNKIEGTTSNIYDKKVMVNIPSTFNLDPSMNLEVRANKMFNSCKVTMRSVLDSYYYSGNDLGVTYTEDKINLKLWAPTAANVNVMSYSNYADAPESGVAVPMIRDEATGVWSASLGRNNFYGKYYMYKLNFSDGSFSGKTTYAVDPYAAAVGVNGDKGAFVALDDVDTLPAGWNGTSKPELKNPEDSIIYEMHIRDFTIDANSGVDSDKRGKFLGAVQSGTVYHDDNGNADSSVKTGVDHLKELGVTHVHLIPVYDFGSVDETKPSDPNNRNWGYDPKNYNAVEGSYSTNPNDPKVRIKEFRQLVQGMHDAGIRVIMDVVYNHMQSTANMDNIVPGYYFRSDAQGNYTNGSGCGNEVASDRPMVHKFIVDSSKHWANDYNIDGLRFDLMSLLDTDTIKDATNSIKTINPTNIVYGEPWSGGSSSLDPNKQTVDGTQRNNHFGVFNDTFRDALRGSNDPGKGYINDGANSDTAGKVQEGIKGSINGLTADPEETINYAEVHDNYCLWDQISKSLGQSPEQYRNNIDSNNLLNDKLVKMDILAQGIVMTSQGIPLTQAGGEFLRTKKGDGNSYKSPDDINEVDWKNKKDYSEIFNYNKGLIQLRKEHPAFRMTNAADIQGNLGVWTAKYNSNIILTNLKNHANGDKWNNIVVIYNPTAYEYNLNDGATGFPTPAGGNWHCVVNDTQAGTTDIGSPFSGRPTVKPYSIMVLYDEEQKVTNIDWSYLFADQSKDYMEPMEPTAEDSVKVRLRGKADDISEAYVHFYDTAASILGDQKIAMNKITDDSFYTAKGYDKTKVEFWEGVIPKGAVTKYYNFEVKSNDKTAWVSGGTHGGGDNKGVTDYQPRMLNAYGEPCGVDYGFMIVPNYNTSNWSKEAILYQIMVDRFRNGDTSNDRTVLDPAVGNDPYDFTKPSEILKWNDVPKAGYESDKIWNNDFYNGDLQGVEQALPYLKDQLGVTGLYLMPIFQSQSNHKYDTEDYEHADKNFGGNKALQELINKAHSSNINIMLDGVFNHTSTATSWFKDAKDNVNSPYRNYYFFGNNPGYLSQGYYGWNGMPSLPKLNYSNTEVQNYIYSGENSIVKKYLKQPYGIDGWRMDAADDISMSADEYKSGAPNHNSENLTIWEGMNKAIKETNPNALVLGEYWGNDSQWLDGKHWDGKMNYSGFYLPFVQNRNANGWLGSQSLDNNGSYSVADMGVFTRNQFKTLPYQAALNSTNSISTHDRPRFLDWDYTGKGNKAMMQLASALQMTYVGVPMIYYGDEIGTKSASVRTDKSRLDDGNDPYNRGTFDWDPSNWDMDMFNTYRKLIETRKDHKEAFVYGAFEEVTSHRDNKYIVYARYGSSDKSLVVLNNSNQNSSKLITVNDVYRYGFKDGDILKDAISGNTVVVTNGTVVINSKDMTASVYVLGDGPSNIAPVTAPALDTAVKESRTQLSEVTGVKAFISNSTNEAKATVSWNNYTDTNAKDILVRLYDANNVVCAEKAISITENSCSFENLPTGNYRAAVKAEADRSKADVNGIDDQYMDSIITITGTLGNLPEVTAITPAAFATGVSKTADITLTFSKNVQEGTGFKNISLKDTNGNVVAVQATLADGVLTIHPTAALGYNTAYTVIVPKDGVVDEAGNSLAEDYVSTFITELDTVPPVINSTSVLDGAIDVALNSKVTLTFSKDIVQGDNYNEISLKDSLGNKLDVLVTVSGNTLIVTPTSALKDSAKYTLTVPAGAVKDTAGNVLVNETSLIFTTIRISPEVTAITPAAFATGVSTTADITLTFSKNVQEGTGFKNISLKDTNGNVVAVQATLAEGVLTIHPSVALGYNTAYTVIVPKDGVADEAGNSLAGDYVSTFITELDSSPLVIKSTILIEGAKSVALSSKIMVNFSKKVLPGPNYSGITLFDNAGNVVKVQISTSGNTLVITPYYSLKKNGKFFLVVPAGVVKDSSGNMLGNKTILNFKANGNSQSNNIICRLQQIFKWFK